jgi:hypothetical protein
MNASDYPTQTARVCESGRKNPSQRYKATAFGQTFYFGYFAGATYRQHGRFMLLWDGITGSITVKKIREG